MSVRAKRWNRQEYESLVGAGAFAPNTHVQLIDGEIVELTPQSRAHAVATRAVEEASASRPRPDMMNPSRITSTQGAIATRLL